MKILAIGANGIIGKAVVNQLRQSHEVIPVGHRHGDYRVDIDDKESIRSLFNQVGQIDAIISMAGNGEICPLEKADDSVFNTVLSNKVMGQINLVRIGLEHLREGGSITLTSGQAANTPIPGTSAIAMGAAAINAFTATAALEMTNGQRINAVSPAMVKETMDLWGIDSSTGIPASDVATYYQKSVESNYNGAVLNAVSNGTLPG